VSAKPPLKICVATAELAPLAKAGGLADVCSALAAFFDRRGHDARLLMPLYSTVDTGEIEIAPIASLQNRRASFGTHTVTWSIDTTVLPGTGARIYLLRCPELYDRGRIYTEDEDEHLRFLLLSQAALAMCRHMRFAPDIFHCHDWHAALVPLYLKSVHARNRLFAKTRTMLTIHNLGYQGVFDARVLGDLGLDGAEVGLDQKDLRQGYINFLKTGVLHADLLTTVSPTYAREIQQPEYGMGLDDLLRRRSGSLVGILNGVDYDEWNPETDPLIPENYSLHNMAGKGTCKGELLEESELEADLERPLVGMIARLTPQKGIDLIEQAMPDILGSRSFSLVVLGSGDGRYERFFESLQRAFPGRVAFRSGYDNPLAHRIEAGSDLFLMPSHYEPCGLNQMYSLRYGTVPVVRLTGGLADSVQHYDPESGQGDGIVFRDYDANGLRWALETALDLYGNRQAWRQIVRNGMRKDFSWDHQGEEYVSLFRRLLAGT
jgi:starch synthase